MVNPALVFSMRGDAGDQMCVSELLQRMAFPYALLEKRGGSTGAVVTESECVHTYTLGRTPRSKCV